MATACVGIVSLELDLHAHAVAQRLRERFNISTHVFATDDYVDGGRVTFDTKAGALVSNYSGDDVTVADVAVLWWRRANQRQKPIDNLDVETQEFVSSEWKFALGSIWQSEFRGTWVNQPTADQKATSKTAQLRAAQACGLQVPATLISNSPQAIRSFLEEHSTGVVVKKLAGVAGQSLATVEITAQMVRDEEARLCPAVYQQKINAHSHLRVIVLGDDVISIALQSDMLDWRRNLHFKAQEHELDNKTRAALFKFINYFDLKMGVFDLIVDRNGDIWFLEINPQGQFLFLQPITKVDLIDRCAAFFAAEFNASPIA